jgi:hypothetical protein
MLKLPISQLAPVNPSGQDTVLLLLLFIIDVGNKPMLTKKLNKYANICWKNFEKSI